MAGLSSSLLRLLLLLSISPSAFALPSRISIRDATCSASGLEACPSGLPSSFCCPQGATCMALAGATTAVCCPKGSTCDKIQPITCDLRQQDPSVDASVAIKTSVFDVPLESCGSGTCCPFGYSCSDGKECRKNSDQSTPPAKETSSPSMASSASSSSSATSTVAPTGGVSSSSAVVSAPTSSPSDPLPTGAALSPPSSSPSSPSPAPIQLLPPSPTLPAPGALITSESSPASTTPPPAADPPSPAAPESSHASNPKTMSIIGGAVGASVVIVVIGMVAFLLVKRNRHQPPTILEKGSPSRLNHHGSGGDGGRHGGGGGAAALGRSKISDPIEQGNSYRTEFILKRITKSFSGRGSGGLQPKTPPRMPPVMKGRSSPTSRFSRLPNPIRRLTIPNPFDSPSPSRRSPTPPESSASPGDDQNAIHGRVAVGARLKPIRAMKVSSARVSPQIMPPLPPLKGSFLNRDPSSENINVFADPHVVAGADWRTTRGTTFTDLMDEADLGDVRRGKPYVPRVTSGI